MITLAILGIATTMALPTWERFAAKSALDGGYNLVLSHLFLARSEAIKRGLPMTLCPTADGRHCLENHRAWGNGLLLFINPTARNDPESSQQIVARSQQIDPDIVVATSSNQRNSLTFLPSGRSWFSNTTVRICHLRYPWLNRALVISGNGRIRRARFTPNHCR